MQSESLDGAIKKFTYATTSDDIAKSVTVYRSALLYLRYAEAVNRAGKPNLAFAALKYPLNSSTLAIDTVVPASEKYLSGTETLVDYVDFSDELFLSYWVDDTEIFYYNGVHSRGCGNTRLSTTYDIPSTLTSTQDSIEWVEDEIVKELALEMAFEGNRFHDLMRIALRRGDNSYLADRVKSKNSGLVNDPLDQENWYLK